ncbi:MAG: hypothetical protein LBK60_01140 [Verrucomicrobiales bacterium]|jgi:hypothetical protein|nr:hypothetical protein [Verrucomicrobiales bacterium]
MKVILNILYICYCVFLVVLCAFVLWLVLRWALPIRAQEMPGTYIAWLPDNHGKDILILKRNGSFLQEIYINDKVIKSEGRWELSKDFGWTCIILKNICNVLTIEDKIKSNYDEIEKKTNIALPVSRNFVTGNPHIEMSLNLEVYYGKISSSAANVGHK